MRPSPELKRRLNKLSDHLRAEQPTLAPILPLYQRFDYALRRMGLLPPDESLAQRISWWPVVTVVGQFSAGKSTFINEYVGTPVQRTGAQAVDDRFTVITYGPDAEPRTLPGTALDADARFPFHRMSDSIEQIATGEGRRIDAFLQLKTIKSEALNGRILVDSPGFDSDEHRDAVLRLADHILDLSDLVLVLFDARKAEVGVMKDTLKHLVAKAVGRADCGKFVYILNACDTAAAEDNLEEVFAAWQRSIAHAGLVSGTFYSTFSAAAGERITDPATRARYEQRRDRDAAEIRQRIADVGIGREYRIISMLDAVAGELEGDIVPALDEALGRWRRSARLRSSAAVLLALAAVAGGAVLGGPDVMDLLIANGAAAAGVATAAVLGALSWARRSAARKIAATLPERMGEFDLAFRHAFLRSARTLPLPGFGGLRGWGRRTRQRIADIREETAALIERINDRYSRPSGAPTPAK